MVLLTAYCVLLTGLTGCESLQRKFVRKTKPRSRPSPIINFQDYSTAMTPLERYRKHLLLFEYWDDQLLDELQQRDANPKRLQLASSESLQELKLLAELLQTEAASKAEPILKERARIDREIREGTYAPSQLDGMRRVLEGESRRVHRELFWRRVQDQLKDQSPLNSPKDAF